MNIKFTDRFNREFLDEASVLKNIMGYDQARNPHSFNRGNLPAIFWLDGDIYWCNTKIQYHCTTGPSKSMITGRIVFTINGKEMSKLEWLLKNEY